MAEKDVELNVEIVDVQDLALVLLALTMSIARQLDAAKLSLSLQQTAQGMPTAGSRDLVKALAEAVGSLG